MTSPAGDPQTSRGRRPRVPLAAVSRAVPVLPATAAVRDAERLFAEDPGLRAVLLTSHRGLWLLPRRRLRAPGAPGEAAAATDAADPHPLVLAATHSLADAAAQLLGRPRAARLDDAVLALPGGPRLLVPGDVLDELAREIRGQDEQDPVTGLPGPEALAQRGAALTAPQGARGAQPAAAAVLYAELAGLAAVVEDAGTAAADEVLAAFAERLRTTVRPDDAVARLGGAEFAALLTGVTAQQARAVAERVLLAAAPPFLVADEPVYLAATVGLVTTDQVSRTPGRTFFDTCLARAREAMVRAREDGAGVGRPAPDASAGVASFAAAVGRRLPLAVSHRSFAVYFQPQLQLGTGRTDSVEALLRWNDAELGRVTPGEFLPVAESIAALDRLERWTLHEACAQAACWAAAGRARTVTVNVSASWFASEGFADDVLAALARSALPARLLRLEIAAGTVAADPGAAAQRLARLDRAGLRADLDGFGADHTSLRPLWRLPLRALKLDRSLVADVDTDATRQLLVEALADAVHRRGLRLAALGVERPAQLLTLRELGCDEVQGFLVARPVPPEVLDDAVEHFRRTDGYRLVTGDPA